jgi:hypothetical protein
MKLLNVKNVSVLALSVAISTAAFANKDLDIATFEEMNTIATVPANFQSHLEMQDKAAQAQEEYNNSYQNVILQNGVAAAKFCGQKAIDATTGLAEFAPVKYAINMAGAFVAVDAFGTPIIEAGLDILGAAVVPVVGPVGPVVATGLKLVNRAADWIPPVKAVKNVLIANAVKDYVVPGAVGAAKFVYNNAGTIYDGAAATANYLNNWWYGAPAEAN